MNLSSGYSERVTVKWQRIQVEITNETRNLPRVSCRRIRLSKRNAGHRKSAIYL